MISPNDVVSVKFSLIPGLGTVVDVAGRALDIGWQSRGRSRFEARSQVLGDDLTVLNDQTDRRNSFKQHLALGPNRFLLPFWVNLSI